MRALLQHLNRKGSRRTAYYVKPNNDETRVLLLRVRLWLQQRTVSILNGGFCMFLSVVSGQMRDTVLPDLTS